MSTKTEPTELRYGWRFAKLPEESFAEAKATGEALGVAGGKCPDSCPGRCRMLESQYRALWEIACHLAREVERLRDELREARQGADELVGNCASPR